MSYPLKLEGIILSYTDGGSPVYRTFPRMDDLLRFVGRFTLNNHRSDSHWIDSVVEGSMLVTDDSVRIEHDEDTYTGAEPEDYPEHNRTDEGNQELDGTEEMAGSSERTGSVTGDPKHPQQYGIDSTEEICHPESY